MEDTMPKKTRLGDDAAIYQQRNTQKSEKEKLKNMPWKKRFGYIWDYYKYYGLAVILAVIFISYIIYTIVKPRTETKLYAVIINNTIEDTVWDEYEQKMTEYLELDPETEKVILSSDYYFNGAVDYAASMQQVFLAHLTAAEIDVVIAPLSVFSGYVKEGLFVPLSDQLPTDLYSSLTDKFYLSDTEDNPRVSAYGIYLTDTKLFKQHSLAPTDDDPFLIGIVANSENKKNAIEFIRYIYNEK